MNQAAIGDYTVLHSIRLDGYEHIVAENAVAADDHYKIFKGSGGSTFGIKEYTELFESRDYIKTMREYVRMLGVSLDSLHLDQVYRGSPDFEDVPLTDEDCVPNSMDCDLQGKVIAIKTGVLMPEYRSMSYQLHLATGGFGCSPDALGRKVCCTNLYSGEERTFHRADILGVIAEDSPCFPKWAKDKLTHIRGQPEKDKPPQYTSVLEKINEGRQKPKEPSSRKPLKKERGSDSEL